MNDNNCVWLRLKKWNLAKRVIMGLGLCLTMFFPIISSAAPPYSGTIFIDPDIVTPSDPSVYSGIRYTGRGNRTVYDRRSSSWVTINAYLYDITFSDGLSCEAQINPEFGGDAQSTAELYGRYVGQLPYVLRKDVDMLWIHKGTQPFGGGNRSILIHTGQSANYIRSGILEETLIHEASHTSLDPYHATASGWISAQNADGEYISTYGRDYPQREDVAESYLPYLAIRHKKDRISSSTYNTIVNTIPNRIAYFDRQNFNISPWGDDGGGGGGDDCTAPNVSVGTKTSSSIQLSWGNVNANSHYIYARKQGGSWYLAASNITGTSYTLSGLSASTTYDIDVYSVCPNGTYPVTRVTAKTSDSGGGGSSLAEITSPNAGSTLSGSSVTFTWTNVSGSKYLYVGTSAGGNDIFGASVSGTSKTVSGIPTNGSKIYVRMWTYSGSWQYKDYTYTAKSDESNGSTIAEMISPTPGSRLGSSATFKWANVSGSKWLYVGTSLGGSNVHNASVSGTSKTVYNIPAGRTIYVRLWTYSGGWKYKDYTYKTY